MARIATSGSATDQPMYIDTGSDGGGGDGGGGGGGGGQDYFTAINAQRDAIAQAMQAQQQQYAQMMAMQQGGGWGGGAPQAMDYSQYFGRPGQSSGNITDVGWMNALQPWQGGVSIGGFPTDQPSGGNPYIGGGSMAWADPNYWFGGSGGNWGGLTPAYMSSAGPQFDLRQGGGLSGSSGYGAFGGFGGFGGGYGGGGNSGYSGGGPFGGNGPAVGPNGISPSEANQAAQGVFGSGTTGFNNYGGITGPSSVGNFGSIASSPGEGMTVGAPGSGTSFGSSGYGGFGLGAGPVGPSLGGLGIGGLGMTGSGSWGGDFGSPW